MNDFSMRSAGSRIPRVPVYLVRCAIATLFVAAVVAAGGVLGCGMAASPQPPSLKLPKPVHDLAAARVGDRVTLAWTAPQRTTDRLRIETPVRFEVCRRSTTAPCKKVGARTAAPGKAAQYIDKLPARLASGPPRAIVYQVLALNQHGRTAGPSNPAVALAGAAPPPVENLTASEIERGVVLHWRLNPAAPPATSVELRRTLLNPSTPNPRSGQGLPVATEPTQQTLRVSTRSHTGTALDTGIQFNRKYKYVAARIAEATVGGQRLRVSSVPSQPIVIATRDTFPPAVPTGLAAVPVPASMNNGVPEVDLSWLANTEPDLAQYRVYRRDLTAASPVRRLASKNSTPIVAPAFRDPHVQSGRTYAYSVAAVDTAGNESSRSAEVMATVPGP